MSIEDESPAGNRTSRRSFDIPKVVVVLALVSVVAILVVLRVPRATVCVFPASERSDAVSLASAAALFRATDGFENCPTVQDLRHDPFASEDVITEDAWGTPYRIACTSESVVVVSAGPDLAFGTEDDFLSDGS